MCSSENPYLELGSCRKTFFFRVLMLLLLLLLPVLIKKSIFRLANAFQTMVYCVCVPISSILLLLGKIQEFANNAGVAADHFIAFIFFSMLLLIKLVLFKVLFKIIFAGNNIKIHQKKTQIRHQRKKKHYLHLHFFFSFYILHNILVAPLLSPLCNHFHSNLFNWADNSIKVFLFFGVRSFFFFWC